jgi:hypothetical protein
VCCWQSYYYDDVHDSQIYGVPFPETNFNLTNPWRTLTPATLDAHLQVDPNVTLFHPTPLPLTLTSPARRFVLLSVHRSLSLMLLFLGSALAPCDAFLHTHAAVLRVFLYRTVNTLYHTTPPYALLYKANRSTNAKNVSSP